MTQKDYRYQQAYDLWHYNGIIKDGYSLIDGVIVPDNELQRVLVALIYISPHKTNKRTNMQTYTNRYKYRTTQQTSNKSNYIKYIGLGVIIILISLIVNTETYQSLMVALSQYIVYSFIAIKGTDITFRPLFCCLSIICYNMFYITLYSRHIVKHMVIAEKIV